MKVVILWAGPASAWARRGNSPEADDRDRDTADPLAQHEVVRVVGPHGFHPLPPPSAEIIRNCFLSYDEALATDFVLFERRTPRVSPRLGHLRFADHVRGHGRPVLDRRASRSAAWGR